MDIRFPFSTWSAISFLIFFVLISHAHSGVIINGTRVIFLSDDKEVTVDITNKGKRPVLVQSWLDTGNSQATPDTITTPFVLTPPINRLDADKAQSLRITAVNTASLAKDRESLFWLNVLEVPGRPSDEYTSRNFLQLAVRSRIKFFWRPVSLKEGASNAPLSLKWSTTSQGIVASNPTPYYISLATILIGDEVFNADMIDPFSSRIFTESKGTRGSAIKAQWIDDYGAIRSQSFSIK